MTFEEKVKRLRQETDLEGLIYNMKLFILKYDGSALSTGRAIGFEGTDKNVYSRLSKLGYKKEPRIVEFMRKYDMLLAKKVEATGMLRNAIQVMDEKKDELDLSWCNQKQARFLLCYSGSLPEAARLAGYTGDDLQLRKTAHNLLRDKRVKAAIKILDKVLEEEVVMSSLRAKVILTRFAEDENLDNRQRQAAITTILKSHGALSEKLIIDGHIKQEHEHHLKPVFLNLSPGALGRSLGIEIGNEQEVIDVEPQSTSISIEDVL